MDKVCPVGFFCFDRNTILLIIVCFIIIVCYQIYTHSKFLDIQHKDLNSKKSELIQMSNVLSNKDSKISDLRDENTAVINENTDYKRNADEHLYILNKDHERIINPLLPPERSSPYRINQRGIAVNIPTRGVGSDYQQVGSLTESGTDGKILPLFGKPYYPGSRQWFYYTGTDSFSSVKLPVVNKNKSCQGDHGCDEIYDGDSISVTGYNDKSFQVNLYEIDKPKYIPYIV